MHGQNGVNICRSYNSWPIITVIKRKWETKFRHEHFLYKNIKKNKIRTWEIVVTPPPLLLRGEFLSTVCTTFHNFPTSPLIKGHCILCNTYTLKLTCTTNLSRLSQVTIQVILLLINTKFFKAILTNLLSSIKNSSQVTTKSTRLLQHYC